ncbi:MAG TPA: putative O-glycosylation ligase, exosortase A system-associated [Rhodanobacteraceae bacterium]|nr:putative O-glycosylation ligase, exosortase A system-associated [Rhodanobacteraceae bacterium]
MRDIALALFVFGMIPYILMRPYVGLLVWSWLGYMNPYRLCYGFAISFPWVQLVAIVTLVSMLFNRERKTVKPSSTVILLFLFFAWTTLTAFYAVQQDSAWQTWEQFGKTLIMVLVTFMLVNDRKRIHWLVWVIVISIGFYGLKGGIFTALRGGAYHVYGPAKSFIADNNDLAQALCMILPLMRYLQLQASRKYVKLGLGVALFIVGIGILGTYSRGGLVALAVVCAALFLKGRKKIMLALVFLSLGVTAYNFMPAQWMERMDTLHHADETDSMQTRMQSWEFATQVALHRPLVGGGMDVYQSATMWSRYGPEDAVPRAVHSIYFRVLGEQGFPGLVMFVALLFVSWRNCAKVRRRTRDSPSDKWAFDLASMLQVSLLAFMTAGLATTSTYFDLSYQIMAMCVLLKEILEARTAESMVPGRGDIGRGDVANGKAMGLSGT